MNRPPPTRSDPEAEPGSLLGERRVACFRCRREFPESALKVRPPGAGPGKPRILICPPCDAGESVP